MLADDSPMENLDLVDFSKNALGRLASLTANLAAQKRSGVAGSLAASLCIAMKSVESADVSRLPKLQRRLPGLIKDLERICAVSTCADLLLLLFHL